MKSISVLIVLVSLIQICSAQTPKTIDWNSDIDLLAQELPRKHFNFFTVKSKNDFLNSLNKIKSECSNLTDFEVAVRLQQVVAGFGDSHTKIDFGQFIDKNKILPLHLYWFSDGLFILHTTPENSEILGHQILSLNNVPLKKITDSLSTLVTVDNQAIVKNIIPKLFPAVQLLKYFGFINGKDIQLALKNSEGKIKTHTIKPAELNRQNRLTYKPDSLALCFKNERIFFIDYYQATDKIYYLQYNNCWSKELELQKGNASNAAKMPSFNAFENEVFKTLQNMPVNKVVFDIRFNGGGSAVQGKEFIEKYAKYLKTNSSIKTYVILGRSTFSSAILNAMDFKRLTDAVFIGEETSGKPSHFGEVESFQLPSSGMRVYYSTKHFERTNKNVNTLAPDIEMEPSFVDFRKGIDPAYEWIRKQ